FGVTLRPYKSIMTAIIRSVFFTFLICLSIPVLAQNAIAISGKITNEKSEPVTDASVHLLNTNIAVFTDAQGNYNIGNIHTGKYIISFSAVGYATQNKD